MTYTIIGGDKNEYGPISDNDIRAWIAEGRLNAQSLAKSETDTAWRTLGSFPEFAAVLTAGAPPAIAPAGTSLPPSVSMDFLNRDYEIDIGGCISQGWVLVKDNLGVLLVGALIYFAIQIAAAVLGKIPLIGFVFSLANFVICGPLMGGLLYLSLRVIRRESAQASDIFDGFSRAFGQLFLTMLVESLLLGVCLLPFIIVMFIKAIPLAGHVHELQQSMQNGTPPSPDLMAMIKSMIYTSLPVMLVCMIPSTYLAVCWKFSLPLVIDKQMDFWTAMKTSWKMVNKHWWQVFGVVILIDLLNVAGVFACCLGILFTMPVGFAALMYAYETIFGARKN